MREKECRKRKKKNRDHTEVCHLLSERFAEQRENVFFETVVQAREELVEDASLYDCWMIHNKDDQLPDLDIIKAYFKDREGRIEIIYRENNVVVYPIPADSIEEINAAIDDFLSYMEKHDKHVFIVHSFNCIWMEQFYSMYRTAVSSLQDLRTIYPASDIYTYQHVCFVAAMRELYDSGNQAERCGNILGNLMHRYPLGEPIKVLEVYFLDAGMDLGCTAKRLYLHRNTAKYRLHKISHLIGIDVLDATKSQFLIMALAMGRIWKKDHHVDWDQN